MTLEEKAQELRDHVSNVNTCIRELAVMGCRVEINPYSVQSMHIADATLLDCRVFKEIVK